MANQITVNSGTGNITVTTSRSVIGTVANVASANFANVANIANTAISLNANIANVSISGGVNGYVLQTDGAGNLSWTAQTGGGGNANAAGSNTQVQFNDAGVFGADANLTFDKTTGTLTANKIAGNGSAITNINGSNVTGTVANATYAVSAGSANTAGTVTTNSQPNITSVGTLTNLAVTGNITANTVTANYLVGNVSLTNIDSLYFDTAAGVTLANVGQVAWDDGDGTLQLLMKGGNVTQQIGTQEYARVYNAEATTLNKGEVVYIFGAQGNRLSVKRAQANAEATSFGTVGFVAETIASGSEGFIITSGALYKLNTLGLTAGNAVYLSPSVAGGYTTTKPVAPNQLVVLGWIERVSATVGSIYVKVDNGYELDELHDVLITSPTAGQALVYNASNLWVNGNPNVANTALSVAVANVSGIGNIATINLDGNASNVLRGDGTFSAESGNLNANYANFAGDVVNASQANITSVGNLTSLQVGSGTNDTLRFTPSGSNLTLQTGNVLVAQTRIANAIAPIDAVVMSTNAAFATGYTQQIFTPNGSNVATIGSISYSTDAALGASNAAQPGSMTFRTFTPGSDLANANVGTSLDFVVGTNGLLVNQKTPIIGVPAGTGIIQTINYGEANNLAAQTGLRFQRRRGNNNSRLSVEPNDYLGNIEWRAGRGGSNYGTNTAKLSAKVDGAYTANANPVPIGMELVVCNTSSTITHNFYANGNVAFAGTISATNIGNVAAANFDGNASNILYGNGVFAAAAGGANANYANFAGDVVNSTQSNITLLGNLVSLQVGNGSANTATTTFTPVGANITTLAGDIFVNNKRVSYDDADVLANGISTQDAIIMPNDTGNGISQDYIVNYLIQDLANTSNIATLSTETVGIVSSYTAGDAAAPSQHTYSIYTSDSDLANANPNTTLDVTYGGTGLFINQKMPNQNNGVNGAGIIGVLNYGEAGDPSSATGIRFQRRRGNNSGGTSTRLPVQANDYLSNISWRGAGTTSGGVNSGTVTFGAKVDGSYGGPGNIMPIGMEMVVINNSNSAVTHNFYANGNVNFSGAISATNIGNVANTNFDGNSSNVLLGNGVFGSAPATQIVNGNSKVDFTGSGGDCRINIDGRQFATFTYGRSLQLVGVSGDFANASQLQLNNGGVQIINEDLLGGLPSFEFKSYYTTGGTIAPYVFQRARGTFASPANAQSGDAIMNQSFQAYSGSGFVNAGGFSATVVNNDNAGNIETRIEINTQNINDGSKVKLNSDIIDLTANSNIELNGDTVQAANTLFQFSGYTATALTAITGVVGQVAAVTDNGGKLAYWDTTNTRWSYVHDNSAV